MFENEGSSPIRGLPFFWKEEKVYLRSKLKTYAHSVNNIFMTSVILFGSWLMTVVQRLSGYRVAVGVTSIRTRTLRKRS